MQKQYELKGVLSDNADGIVFDAGKAVSRILSGWKGKPLHIVIKPFSRKRSDAQNRWLWGVAYVCVRAYLLERDGEAPTAEEIHLHNMQYIQGCQIKQKTILGYEVFVVEERRKSSSMSTVEWNEMKEKFQKYWAEQGCVIPDPRKDNMLSDYADLSDN